MTRDTISPPEDYEQQRVFAWIDQNVSQYPQLALAFHVPNGGHRNPTTGARMKLLGVKPGVPDILLPVFSFDRKYIGLAIEMKREHGGRVSKEQRAWLNNLAAQGWWTVVCHGSDSAIDEIVGYLGIVEEVEHD